MNQIFKQKNCKIKKISYKIYKIKSYKSNKKIFNNNNNYIKKSNIFNKLIQI